MMEVSELEKWLREEDESRLETLWERADRVRREHVGDEVHLRGLLEISNYCVRLCGYCGIRSGNGLVKRYRMEREEILDCVREAASYGYGTVVLQAGEDYGLRREWVTELVEAIKGETELAVTLSLGERPDEDLAAWRRAGADRYLLRFETSDPALYRLIHPDRGDVASDRIAMLRRLQSLGYETGSGVMVGIPGQSYEILAKDFLQFGGLDLDMIGVGPYISHPDTPMGKGEGVGALDPAQQVSATELMTYKAVALARLVCPEANIPSTTALATLNLAAGRELGLQRGANVVMPNVTPAKYRVLYEIYPGKACITETAGQCQSCMKMRIDSIGRSLGKGPGGRRRS